MKAGVLVGKTQLENLWVLLLQVHPHLIEFHSSGEIKLLWELRCCLMAKLKVLEYPIELERNKNKNKKRRPHMNRIRICCFELEDKINFR
jgi:hypothetical protein